MFRERLTDTVQNERAMKMAKRKPFDPNAFLAKHGGDAQTSVKCIGTGHKFKVPGIPQTLNAKGLEEHCETLTGEVKISYPPAEADGFKQTPSRPLPASCLPAFVVGIASLVEVQRDVARQGAEQETETVG